RATKARAETCAWTEAGPPKPSAAKAVTKPGAAKAGSERSKARSPEPKSAVKHVCLPIVRCFPIRCGAVSRHYHDISITWKVVYLNLKFSAKNQGARRTSRHQGAAPVAAALFKPD